jgi:hypothetical protein
MIKNMKASNFIENNDHIKKHFTTAMGQISESPQNARVNLQSREFTMMRQQGGTVGGKAEQPAATPGILKNKLWRRSS